MGFLHLQELKLDFLFWNKYILYIFIYNPNKYGTTSTND